MQMNHFPEALPWFHKPAVDSTRNLNHYPVGDDFEDRLVDTPIPMHDKEAMFEKPLTPSDVGKLNRLVIPKQHAERYFPLGAGDAAGTLLGFEDEAGKSWRFRYSYWNSSQSYVLTKGWSRYVKDKRLDAGDVVFFERHRADREKLFIGWRRRGTAPSTAVCYNAQGYRLAPAGIPPNYQPDCPPRHPGGGPAEEEEKATPVQSASNNNNTHHPSTRLVRLFGVNFECQRDDSSPRTTSSEGSTSSSIQQQQQQQAYHNYFNYMGYPAAAPSYHHHQHQHQHQHQMDMEYEHVVKQMGNRLS